MSRTSDSTSHKAARQPRSKAGTTSASGSASSTNSGSSKSTSKPAAKKLDNVSRQLRRVRGQIDGVIGMYENERACVDIVRQVVAARNSLGSVARDLLTDEASRCSKEREIKELNLILKELFRY